LNFFLNEIIIFTILNEWIFVNSTRSEDNIINIFSN
jgi:hypothetical protein